MPARPTPPPEIEIDDGLVRSLLADQAPELAGREIGFLAEGWDNRLFRLGDDLVVRVPRRHLGALLIEHEQTWLPRLAGSLPLPIPAPVFAGRASERFPWRWSICPWLEGESATTGPIDDPVRAATALGRFLDALHVDAPADAPVNPYRGIALADRHARTMTTIDDLADLIDADGVARAWAASMATPPWTGPASWVHGDLHPGNVLVERGAVVAVIDFGDLCGGDPATDLGIAWMMFDRAQREAFRAAVQVDDDTWERGRGWAIALGLAVLSSSSDRPDYTAFAVRALDEAVA